MKQSKPLISIIVLNWNGQRYIDPFMSSVKKLLLKDVRIEVLFTDNNSADDSVAYYKQNYQDDDVFRLVQNDDNYGYSKGNNLGMLEARGEYILVCNNDLELERNLIEELYHSLIANDADLTVPKLLFLNKKGYINNAGSRLDMGSTWPVTEIGYDEEDNGQYDKGCTISAFCGACVLFKRSFLETVGMYDPRFFMYFEDSDLSWRGQRAKRVFYYEPKAIAYHHHAGSSKEWSPLFTHFVYRNRMLILIKNAAPRVILEAWKITVHDHLVVRTKNLVKALLGRYSKRSALREFRIGIGVILSAVWMTPYALLKRFKVIGEAKL